MRKSALIGMVLASVASGVSSLSFAQDCASQYSTPVRYALAYLTLMQSSTGETMFFGTPDPSAPTEEAICESLLSTKIAESSRAGYSTITLSFRGATCTMDAQIGSDGRVGNNEPIDCKVVQ